MKKKKILLFGFMIIFNSFLSTGVLFAQQEQFIDKLFGKEFLFTQKKSELFVKFSANINQTEMENVLEQAGCSLKENSFTGGNYKVYTFQKNKSFERVKNQLLENKNIIGIMPVFVDQEGLERYVAPDQFTVQFMENVSEERIIEILNIWDSKIVHDHWTQGYYTISLVEDFNVFESVRKSMEWKEVKFAEPVYLSFKNDLLADTYLNNQWHTNNTGQESGYVVGNDINANKAWDITEGVEDVIISVIDGGVDLTHPDLADNYVDRGNEDWFIDSRNGYIGKVEPEATPGPIGAHGTMVSGVCSAIKNNIGVRGVASSCKLIPIRTNLSGTDDLAYGDRADAINYIVSRKDDFTRIVINCSWRTSAGDIIGIHNAIQNAYNNNIPIFFSSGNNGTTPIEYPAKYSETISVGGMPPCEEARKTNSSCNWNAWYDDWGSNYGPNLDISAPGARIYTTDLQGNDGYNPYPQTPIPNELSDQDYTRYSSGTSLASPMIAATAALMLSINSNLTISEIRSILHSTADKVGGYTYVNGRCNDLGYGRLDAYEALKYTIENHGATLGGSGKTVTFHEDITIESGKTLTIESGTTVKFEPGDGLTVEGTLIADGVTFTSTTSSKWDGIKMDGASSSSVIENCTITKATTGISLYSTSMTVETNEISNTSSYGIYIYGGSPIITDNYIHDTGDYGIALNSSTNTYIRKNSIKECEGGVFAWGNPSSILMRGYTGTYYGLNEIEDYDYHEYGVLITGGTADLGVYGGGTYKRGYNNIIKDAPPVLRNTTSSTVFAEKNYWGGSPLSNWFSGNVSWIKYLSTEYSGAGSSLEKSVEIEPDKQLLLEASDLADSKSYQLSSDMFKQLISEYPNSTYGGLALAWSMGAHKLNKDIETQRDYLVNAAKHINLKVRNSALLWLQTLEAESGNKEDCAKFVSTIAIEDEIGVEVRLNWANDLLNLYNDKENAEIIFSEIISYDTSKTTLKTIEAIRKTAHFSDGVDSDNGIIKKEANSITEIRESILLNAYPNPFNPTATISYQLQYKSHVSLIVYNSIGQIVVELVNQQKEKGIYNVDFNASDLSSGLYIYRLQVNTPDGKGNYTQAKKMILLR